MCRALYMAVWWGPPLHRGAMSMMSHQQLETGHDESIYTLEMGKCVQSVPSSSLLLNLFHHPTAWLRDIPAL